MWFDSEAPITVRLGERTWAVAQKRVREWRELSRKIKHQG